MKDRFIEWAQAHLVLTGDGEIQSDTEVVEDLLDIITRTVRARQAEIDAHELWSTSREGWTTEELASLQTAWDSLQDTSLHLEEYLPPSRRRPPSE